MREEFENIGQTYLGNIYRSGSRGDYYGVLRAAASVGIPAVITEFAFIDNPTDVKLVDTKDKRKAEALAIYKAVMRFLDRPESEHSNSEEEIEETSGGTNEDAPYEDASDDVKAPPRSSPPMWAEPMRKRATAIRSQEKARRRNKR